MPCCSLISCASPDAAGAKAFAITRADRTPAGPSRKKRNVSPRCYSMQPVVRHSGDRCRALHRLGWNMDAWECAPSWSAWVYDKRSGKKIRSPRAFLNTELDAAKGWRRDAERELKRGTMRVPTKQAVGEALDAMIVGMEDGTIRERSAKLYKPSTIRSYRQSIENHPRGPLGGTAVHGGHLCAGIPASLQHRVCELLHIVDDPQRDLRRLASSTESEGGRLPSTRHAILTLRAVEASATATPNPPKRSGCWRLCPVQTGPYGRRQSMPDWTTENFRRCRWALTWRQASSTFASPGRRWRGFCARRRRPEADGRFRSAVTCGSTWNPSLPDGGMRVRDVRPALPLLDDG